MSTFVMYGQDNDSYAFREYPSLTEYQQIHQELVPDMSGERRPGVRRCDACGELLTKSDEPLDGLVIKKRHYDISSTYDGITVVSERFMSAYEEASLNGLAFRQLPDDAEFFSINATRTVEFDAERSQTRFINECPQCKHFQSVVTPYEYLKTGNQIGDREFVRTDLEFASDDEKQSMILCGEAAAKSLKQAKLKGLDLTLID